VVHKHLVFCSPWQIDQLKGLQDGDEVTFDGTFKCRVPGFLQSFFMLIRKKGSKRYKFAACLANNTKDEANYKTMFQGLIDLVGSMPNVKF
jgi:hypothetical protein